MSKIILSKTAGFCFGVDRAVKMLFDIIDSTNKEIYTLGPLIHNPQIIKELEDRGVKRVDSINQVPDGALLVARTHGISKSEKDDILGRNLDFTDMTCPYVAKIQNIVKNATEEGKRVLIAGDPEHPEVIAIKGYCNENNVIVFRDLTALIELEKDGVLADGNIILVSQTTYNTTEWEKICAHLNKKLYTNLTKFDTICNATKERQEDSASIAAKVDLMIVIGGKNSSNTTKLFEICKSHCEKTYHIENLKDLPIEEINNAVYIGVTAGASTPDGIIKEVINTMEEIKNENIEALTDAEKVEEIENTEETVQAEADEQVEERNENSQEVEASSEIIEPVDKNTSDFLTAMEQTLKSLHTGELVKAIVLSVQPNEVQLDLGIKHTGIMPLSEISDDIVSLEEQFKVGQEIEAQIIRMNDVEGTVTLSLKRIEALKIWDNLATAKETGEILTGNVSTVVNGGIIVVYKGIRVFIPASHASVKKDDKLEDYVGTNVKFKIIEVETGKRKKVVGSIRLVYKDERRVGEEKVWGEIEVGKQYKGVVKSLTTYGAFIDIGGVDGMAHISELSWSRIKHPSDILNVGDIVSVYVKDIDREGKRISLGYKNLQDNPLEIFRRNFAVGAVTDVKIVKLMPYGAFAQIIPGVDGLIHISELSNVRVNKAADVVRVGDIVKVKITEIDDKNRISLSMRALLPDNEISVDAVEETAALEEKEEIIEEINEVANETNIEIAEEIVEEKKETKAKKAKEEKSEKTEKVKKVKEPKEKESEEAEEETKVKKAPKAKKSSEETETVSE